MIVFLLGLTFLAALADWTAVYKDWKKVEYIAKPAVMILLFAWLAYTTRFNHVPLIWFGLGVSFSLAGDVFLMFSDRWFIPGLLAFLLAHVMYIIGFNLPLPDVSLMWSLSIAVILALTAARVLQRIVAGLAGKGQRKLIGPVVVYGMVITLMLLSAMLTLFRGDWQPLTALSASLGAALFYMSDIILAWNKFVSPFKNGRLVNIIAYHIGQIALVMGVVYQYGPYFR